VVISLTSDGVVSDVSMAAAVLADRPLDDVLTLPVDDLVPGGHMSVLRGRVGEAATFPVRAASGPWRWIAGQIEAGPWGGVVLRGRDVSPQHAVEALLQEQGFNDRLTDLPNRPWLERELGTSLPDGSVRAVVLIDLDRFSRLNDTLGQAVGNHVLTEVVQRWKELLPQPSALSRVGGDQFAVVLTGPDRTRIEIEAVSWAGDLLDALSEPFEIGHRFVTLSASAGVVVVTPGSDPGTVLRQAELAMFRAKANGGAAVAQYDDALHAELQQRMELEDALRGAVSRGEMRLVYQPEIDLEHGMVTVVEALLRWDRPEVGVVGPSRFIDIAEETGLIVPIGRWVLREAVQQATIWYERFGIAAPVVSVNVSAAQLVQADFADDVLSTLNAASLPPSLLRLELTESALADPVQARPIVDSLRAAGVQLAIDDFGTGYSSLAYLRDLQFDTLKIDRSFVSEVVDANARAPLVEAIVALGRSLDLRVDAEGVETPDQIALLRSLGCDRAQGFLFSPGVSPEDLEHRLGQPHGMVGGGGTNFASAE
jgi:diguanylate cyclase (GGDEF)-like protein